MHFFSKGCHVPYVMFPTFYRSFPQGWPANLLPVRGSHYCRRHSGVALHLQEGFPGPLPKRTPSQQSQVNISIVIILMDIYIGYVYILFSVNYYYWYCYCHFGCYSCYDIEKVHFFVSLFKGLAMFKQPIQVSIQITVRGMQQYRLLLLG